MPNLPHRSHGNMRMALRTKSVNYGLVMTKLRKEMLAIYMQQHGKAMVAPVPGEEWKIEYQKNKIKLATVVLLYLYANDDMVLSKKEMKIFRHYLKQNKGYLSEADTQYMLHLTETTITPETVTTYLSDNNLKFVIFEEATREIHELIKKNIRYIRLASDLKDAVREQMDGPK